MQAVIMFIICFYAAIVNAQTCSVDIEPTTPDSHYKVLPNTGGKEILDTQTNLVWQRCSIGQTWDGFSCLWTAGEGYYSTRYTWKDAMTKAKALGNGYRLPNIRELRSLVEYSCYLSSMNTSFFPNIGTRAMYWSSSMAPASADQTYSGVTALGVNFDYGEIEYTGISDGYIRYARAVRSNYKE